MLPDGLDFSEEVFIIAGAAYFAASHTLCAKVRAWEGLRVSTVDEPSSVCLHDLHEVALFHILEMPGLANNASIGKEYIQSSICVYCMANHFFYGLLVRRIKLADMQLDIGVFGVDLPLMRC